MIIGFSSRLTNSLEKCFLDQLPTDFPELKKLTMLRNQHINAQLVYRASQPGMVAGAEVSLEGELAPYVQLYDVVNVPVLMPAYFGRTDDNYLRTTPGLYPDILQPLHYRNVISVLREQTHAMWIRISPTGKLPAGSYTLTVILHHGGDEIARHSLEVELLDAVLPPHGMILTQWFHCDGLAALYNVPVFSEQHWKIVENFVRLAVEYGQTMLLTPIFTPPLDTEIGGERSTVQLVDVVLTDGVYSFGFEKLDRWVEMAHRCGIEWFEISHLFTQWGAEHAPKVMATVDGEYRRIFGWETEATGKPYADFLGAFLPALLAHLKELGIDKKCKFHISDEPNPDNLLNYEAAKKVVEPYLEGYDIMDALSSFEFFSRGVVKVPIPGSSHIAPFLEAKIPGLWTYFCCGQDREVSNRFIAMPSWRNRIIGTQFFRYDIAGFLQWGYNFYNNMSSVDTINPFLENGGDYRVPAGDPFMVYPNFDGTAAPSLRLEVFREGLEDLAAMKLASALCGKDTVVQAVEQAGGEVRFDRCPHSSREMLAIRAAVDSLIRNAVSH